MKPGWVVAMMFALSSWQAAAQSGASVFDPRTMDRDVEGPRTQVLVLASTHLSEAPGNFDVENLRLLLDKLAVFGPKVVAVEYLSGESLDTLERYDGVYPNIANTYGKSMRLAREASGPALGLTPAQAEAESRSIVAAWPPAPAPADRRKLAAIYAAAGEVASATAQWMQLPDKERRAADGVTEVLLPLLDKWIKSKNEALSIGAKLAARMKLNRVYAIDDHSADDVALAIEKPLQDFMSADPGLKALMAEMEASGFMDINARMTSPQAVLEAYRFLNAPETWRKDVSMQWAYFLRLKAANRLGRQRLAEWETRNLRMTANLREAFAHRPGERVLLVVGASHKPYIEAYLSRMHDVDIVDAAAILK